MVVNSLSFLLFFVVVFAVYFLPPVHKRRSVQNGWLLLTSYFYYCYVDWRMIFLLLGSTAIFYGLGIALNNRMQKGSTKQASWITTTGVLLGLGVLFYFKYLDFFGTAVAALFSKMGFNISWSTLYIVLPVGVSFFVFKLISYLIEIHREKIKPTTNFFDFAIYVSFFPTILAGPIDRPNTFLPQLKKARLFDFNKAVDGCQQILWGIMLKTVVADNLAVVTRTAWTTYADQSSTYLLWAIILSPIQVYADFDGYSNMAIGVGKILGFDITRNFNHPLLARNVSEYWRRWHMSLTNWITDYVFMPLNIAFRNWGKLGIWLAITINLIAIGVWHGANYTYVFFGLYHSLLFLPIILAGSFGKNKKLKATKHNLPYLKDLSMMALTYLLIGIGHTIFFAPRLASIAGFYEALFLNGWEWCKPLRLRIIVVVIALFIIEWTTRDKEFALQRPSHNYTTHNVRLLLFDVIFALFIIWMAAYETVEFVYFKF